MNKKIKEQIHKMLTALENINDIVCSNEATLFPKVALNNIKKISRDTLKELDKILGENVNEN